MSIRCPIADGRDGQHRVVLCRSRRAPTRYGPDEGKPQWLRDFPRHPIGATGAIITTKAIHELHRIKGRYALVTMCIGGGQGIAAIFERV
jgi:hypothetical protein